MLKKLLKKSTNYLSLVKFAHTVFALPFALIGFSLAINQMPGEFSVWLLLQVVLCMVFARNAAMAFNRYADRNIDKINPRTAIREIPDGVIKPKSALFFVVLNVVLFIGVTFFINRLVFFLSPIAIVIVLGYSYTKRFTWLAHLVLGLGLSLSPIGAYLAVTGRFDILPVLYSLIVLFWVAGFDIIYAMQDEEFDKSQNLKSIPVFLGKKGALNFSSFLHTLTIALVVMVGIMGDGKILFWIGAVIFIALLIYQHFLVKPTDLSKVNLAFFTTNGFASVVFAVFVIADNFV